MFKQYNFLYDIYHLTFTTFRLHGGWIETKIKENVLYNGPKISFINFNFISIIHPIIDGGDITDYYEIIKTYRQWKKRSGLELSLGLTVVS